MPPDFKGLGNNKSLQCLAAAPNGSPLAGQLIVVAEHSLAASGNHRAFLLAGKASRTSSVKRSDEFDVSDCAILPPSDLLLLERSYSPTRGLAIRLCRIALAAIKPGVLVDGKALISASPMRSTTWKASASRATRTAAPS